MNVVKKLKPGSEEQMDSSQTLEASDLSLGTLDDEAELVGGRVSEIAHENLAESSASSGQKKQSSNSGKKPVVDLTDRLALRDRLLAHAPKPVVMRKEVEKILLQEKERLIADVNRLKRKKSYHLLSRALMQLRKVIRQLEDLARASYEALKEIWLRVVHGFAL